MRAPVCGVFLFLLALCACGSRAGEARLNLLLISLDSTRADFVGAYGPDLPHARGRSPTPHLDRLAGQGVVYENARATTSWTLPSHAALLSGVPELVHGVEQDGQRLPPDLPLLAERLAPLGYRTYGVYSGPYLDPRYGFARGFQRYEAGYGPELTRAADELGVATRLVAGLDAAADPQRFQVASQRLAGAERALEFASHRDVSSERVTDLALAELARAAEGGQPFFLFAHYFDPHYDYAAPEPFTRAFDPDYAGALDGHNFFRNPAIAAFDPSSPTRRRQTASERDLQHVEALYAGEIAWTDSQVGRLLDELERLGLGANTLVVVVGDHGDEFFEHGSIGHRRTLHEEVLRVPLILRLPGVLAAGERRAAPRALCEVQAEILALLGVPHAPPAALAPVGRLIRPEPTTVEFDFGGQPMRVQASRVRILESFWHGPLALQRERALLRATELLKPAQLQAFEQHGLAQFAREELSWADLGESSESWSTDFSDPRARAALEAFRASYAGLARLRHAPAEAEANDEWLAALRGLGYVGEGEAPGAVASDVLVLPLPGEGLAR